MIKKLIFCSSLLSALLVISCGGGGSALSSPSALTGLSGTASVGAPMAGATVTVTDVSGKTITTTADANGGYSISDVSSLTPPLLVSVNGPVGGRVLTLNNLVTSVIPGSTTVANTNPLTDAIVYQAAGQSPGSLASNPSAMSSISSSSLSAAVSNVTTAVSLVLNGLSSGSASSFNPSSTPYVADGSNSYDKVYDLVGIYPTAASSSSYNINVADKSGTNGSVTLTTGQSNSSITPLAPIPSAIATLKLSDLEAAIITLNSAAQVGISSPAFAALFSPNFLSDGFSKTQFISDISTTSTQDYIQPGTTFKNPEIVSCNTSQVCVVQISVYNPTAIVPFPIQLPFINDSASGKWLVYGNQQPDLRNNFTSYAKLASSSGAISVGFEFNIYGPVEASSSGNTFGSNPYNSASVSFQNSAGVVDYTIYFVQKPSLAGSNSNCDKTSSNYAGLPIANLANPTSSASDNSTCSTVTNPFTDETILHTINDKIMAGGYQLVTKAYTSSNWTGTAVVRTDTFPPTPLAASYLLSTAFFPSAQVKTDSSGSYLAISNTSPFVQNGHQCISTLNSCDYTNNPNYTYASSGASSAAPTVIRPAPAWPNGQTINSFSLHLQNSAGWDIFVTN